MSCKSRIRSWRKKSGRSKSRQQYRRLMVLFRKIGEGQTTYVTRLWAVSSVGVFGAGS